MKKPPAAHTPKKATKALKNKPAGNKTRVFLSYAHQDADRAEEIRDALNRSEKIEVLAVGSGEQGVHGTDRVTDIARRIRSSQAYVLIFSKHVLTDTWVRHEYLYAIFHKNAHPDSSYLLIRVVVDDDDAEVPSELSSFTRVDFRDALSLTINYDTLRRALVPDFSKRDRMKDVFLEAMAPNSHLELLKRVLQTEVQKAFREHVGPVKDTLDTLAKLRHAQDNLMTPELIEVEEAKADDDIWVVSHSLHNDLHTKIGASVQRNLEHAGIHYTYFVPDTELIQSRVKEFTEKFGRFRKRVESESGFVRRGTFRFIYLERGVFMPFDEMVIFDGENATRRWGYIQMSYDRVGSSEIFMRIPERTLSTIIEFLTVLRKRRHVK